MDGRKEDGRSATICPREIIVRPFILCRFDQHAGFHFRGPVAGTDRQAVLEHASDPQFEFVQKDVLPSFTAAGVGGVAGFAQADFAHCGERSVVERGRVEDQRGVECEDPTEKESLGVLGRIVVRNRIGAFVYAVKMVEEVLGFAGRVRSADSRSEGRAKDGDILRRGLMGMSVGRRAHVAGRGKEFDIHVADLDRDYIRIYGVHVKIKDYFALRDEDVADILDLDLVKGLHAENQDRYDCSDEEGEDAEKRSEGRDPSAESTRMVRGCVHLSYTSW